MKFKKLNSRDLTKISIFATIYIVTNMIPISQFLGAALFIPISIMFVPVVAYYLTPKQAFISSIVGGTGSLFFNPIGTAGMGIFAIIIPVVAVTLGSIGFHYKLYSWVPIGFLLFEYIFYLLWYKGQATPYWGTHYLIAITLGSYYFITHKPKLFMVPVTAMCENAMLNIFSLTIVGIPAEAWDFIIIPSMIERIVASIGAILLINALNRALPSLWNQNE